MNIRQQINLTRRRAFLGQVGRGVGSVALASLLQNVMALGETNASAGQ